MKSHFHFKNIDELIKYAAYNLQGLRKDFSSLSDEEFMHALNSDPTLYNEIQNFKTWNELNKSNIRKIGSYTIWLLNHSNSVVTHDSEEIRDYLTKFSQIKENENIEFESNIDNYKTFDEIKSAIDVVTNKHKIIKSPAKFKRDVSRFNIKNELGKSFEVAYDSPEFTVLKLLTAEAACFFGKGTNWCTATTTPESNRFNLYHAPENEQYLHVIIDKKNNQKWQYFSKNEFKDKMDKQALTSLISIEFRNSGDANINYFMYQLTGIRDFIEDDDNKLYKNAVKEINKSLLDAKTYYNNPPEYVVLDTSSAESFIKSWGSYNKGIEKEVLHLYDVASENIPETDTQSLWSLFDDVVDYIEPRRGENQVLSAIFRDIYYTHDHTDIENEMIQYAIKHDKLGHYGINMLVSAVHKNDTNLIKTLIIDKGVDVNAKASSNGETPLIAAVNDDDPLIVLDLLQKGADPNIAEQTRDTPLALAIKQDNVGSVKVLLEYGADPTKILGNVIMNSIYQDNTEMAKILFENGADPNIRNEISLTPIYYATKTPANIDITKILIQQGADLNISDNEGNSPLSFAVASNNTELRNLLIESGALFKDDYMILFTAMTASTKDIEFIKYLISNGVPLSDPYYNFTSSLLVAYHNNLKELVPLLIKAGADVDAKNDAGTTVLHEALFNNDVEIAKKLIISGVDVNTYTTVSSIRTPLHIACRWYEDSDLIHLLIGAGSNIEERTAFEETPIMMAARGNNAVAVKILIQAGADVNAVTSDNLTALSYATENHNEEIKNMLLSAGAKPQDNTVEASFKSLRTLDDLFLQYGN